MFEHMPRPPRDPELSRAMRVLDLHDRVHPERWIPPWKISEERQMEARRHTTLRALFHGHKFSSCNKGMTFRNYIPDSVGQAFEACMEDRNEWNREYSVVQMVRQIQGETDSEEISSRDMKGLSDLDQWAQRKDVHPVLRACWIFFVSRDALKDHPLIPQMLVYWILDGKWWYPERDLHTPGFGVFLDEYEKDFDGMEMGHPQFLDLAELFHKGLDWTAVADQKFLKDVDLEFCSRDRHVNVPTEKILWDYCKKNIVVARHLLDNDESDFPAWRTLRSHIAKFEEVGILVPDPKHEEVWLYQSYLNLLDPDSAPRT